jgi:PQQ-dependent catabolism-associated beta-propeller protein
MIRSCVLAALVAALAQGTSPARDLAYVSCERDGSISVIDIAAGRVASTIRTGYRPRGLQMAGSTLFVALSDTTPRQQRSGDAIAAYDTSTGRVTGRYDSGSDPERFAVSRDGRFLFAANEDAGTATITDVHARQVLATLLVGIEPEGVAISPDERWVYVTAETSNTVSVVDTRQRVIASSFMVDPRPRAVAFSPDGARAYVTAEIGGTVSVVDVTRHRVIDIVDLPAGAKPVGVAVSPDGARIYVANGHGNSVTEIDARTLKTMRTIAVGRRPWGIALTADGRKLLTANGASNDVSVVDLAAGHVRTIKVGAGPWDVVIAR